MHLGTSNKNIIQVLDICEILYITFTKVKKINQLIASALSKFWKFRKGNSIYIRKINFFSQFSFPFSTFSHKFYIVIKNLRIDAP